MRAHESFEGWRARHATLWQFIMFALMGCITTAVDFGVFALLNFAVFTHLRETPFSWWIIDYSIANGGLCAFLSFAASFGVSQTFNFFLQRTTTFKANNNVLLSGLLYAVMVVATYFFQLYLPTLLRAPIVAALGAALGDMTVKAINAFTSMLIQFPINKWVIMRRRPTDAV
ncbi:MAG: hypothetical protein Q4B99_06960 [Clostridia bacterium]|nr:hypothetical protein [Clostridia bacterium]